MNTLHTFLWNSWSIVILLLIACFFHYKLNYRIFRNFIKDLKKMFSKEGVTSSQVQIISTSLGAVMGIGNIVGVATALISGGPGAIFWMVISSIIVSSLKYVEIYFACVFRKMGKNGLFGGTQVYIRDGLGKPFLASVYIFLLLVSALTMGNMIVSNTLASIIHEVIGIPTMVSGFVWMILLTLIVSKGVKTVMIVSSYLVPYMIVMYLLVCIGIIGFNFVLFKEAIILIVSEAFRPSSMLGGGVGMALKYGVARGIFSNEAGMGSCTMVHAKSDNEPHNEAMIGVFEVFLDSVVMCFLTGIVLVMSDVPLTLTNAMLFLFEGFGVFLGRGGIPFIVVSLLFFGVTSSLGWYIFGNECMDGMKRGKQLRVVYRILFLIFAFIGSFNDLFYIFSLSDSLNALMIVINLYACLCLVKFLK